MATGRGALHRDWTTNTSLTIKSRRRGHCHALVPRQRRKETTGACNLLRNDAELRPAPPSTGPSSYADNGRHISEVGNAADIPLPSPSTTLSTTLSSPGSSLFLERDLPHQGTYVLGWVSETVQASHAAMPSSATVPSSRREGDGKGEGPTHGQNLESVSPTVERARARAKRRRLENDTQKSIQSEETDCVVGDRCARTPPISPDEARARPNSRPSTSQRLPERPQSAMKHRSANEYSSGKTAPLLAVSANTLPRRLSATFKQLRRKREGEEDWWLATATGYESHDREDDDEDDDNDAAVFGSRKISPRKGKASDQNRAVARSASGFGRSPLVQSGRSLTQSHHISSPSAPSITNDSTTKRPGVLAYRKSDTNSSADITVRRALCKSQSVPNMKQSTTNSASSPAFILQSRANLPESSFYARTKEEERSPTPMRRKHVSMSSTPAER